MSDSARDVLAKGLAAISSHGVGAWEEFREDADAGIAALVAAGYAVVPVEPTAAMIGKGHGANDEAVVAVWHAMLAASPDAGDDNATEARDS